MNFRVFLRALLMVILISALAFTIYANKMLSNGNGTLLPETSQPSTDTDASAGDSAESESTKDTGNTTEPKNGSKDTESTYVRENQVICISAIGDVALGQDSRYKYIDSFDYVYEKKEGDYNYFFANVADILLGDDLTIANLETTLSNETKQAEKYDYGNNYWFNGKPEYANILKAAGIEAANLANNHSYDYGQKGYDATKSAVRDAGVEYFGYEETLCMDIKGIMVGMVGFNQLGNYEQGLDMALFKDEVAGMTQKLRGECDLLIANFHWGKEYKYQPEPLQRELAHLAIDCGADLVIGHHPHVLQPIEIYEGKYIIYSLGNFCFGGNKKPSDFDTAIYQQSFLFDSDNVLQRIEKPNVIPCSVSSQKDFNNYQPALATGEQFDRVLQKLNWSGGGSETVNTGSNGGSTGETGGTELFIKESKSDMVRVDSVVKDIVTDLKYATSDNVAGRPVYESDIAYLRRGTAEKLDKANQIVMKEGYRIKVWDAYRPQKAHQDLYDSSPDKSFFMDPSVGSVHTRGAAVDATLVDADGNEVDMPSGFDELSEKANRSYKEATPEQKKNALLLENAMKSSGFIPYQKEWWHFDDTEYKNYPLLKEYKEIS